MFCNDISVENSIFKWKHNDNIVYPVLQSFINVTKSRILLRDGIFALKHFKSPVSSSPLSDIKEKDRSRTNLKIHHALRVGGVIIRIVFTLHRLQPAGHGKCLCILILHHSICFPSHCIRLFAL